jgi:hypothetical protein
MVYQFSLPPLLLDAWLNEDAGRLVRWLAELAPAPPGTTFLQFHGVARRDRRAALGRSGAGRAIRAAERGDPSAGRSDQHPARAGRRDLPYELNITYFDAVADSGSRSYGTASAAVLGTQALMLALRGHSRRVLFQPVRCRQRLGRRPADRPTAPHQSPQVRSRRVERRAGAGRPAGKPACWPVIGDCWPCGGGNRPFIRTAPQQVWAGRSAVAGRGAPHQPGRAAANPGAGQRQRPAQIWELPAEIGDSSGGGTC